MTDARRPVDHDLAGAGRAAGSPDPRLAGVLARPHVDFRQPTKRSECWVEPPQPAVTLIVSLEGQLRANGRELPGAWVGGLSATYDTVETAGSYACVDLKLTPLGAYTVLGFPVRELTDAVCALDDVFGADGRRVEQRLRETADWESRFGVIDSFLLARMAAGPQPDPGVAWAWSRLRETSGRLPVAALAAELGCSRRHLTARFGEQVGQPPKTVARLLRFQRVRRLLETDPVRWADIAYDCGYCDQSHLNRDFWEFAGTTPSAFIARRLRGAAADAVTFVQDDDRVVH